VKLEIDRSSFDHDEQPGGELGNGAYFARQAERELRRAERYPSFVSLIAFEIIPVGYSWDDELKKKVAEVVKLSLRETDVVGVSNAFRLGVLLVETPRRGAERAAERIAGQLLEFCMKEKGKSKLEMRIHSFPEDPQGKENFLSAIEKLR
jgi:GGDEF domain-containing protein